MSTKLTSKLAMVRDQVVEAYNRGATLIELGKAHEVSPGTVRNVLLEEGVEMRSRGRQPKVRLPDSRILALDYTPSPEEEETHVDSATYGYEGGAL